MARRREEQERRDHRKLGSELDLFSIHEEIGGGLISWHPKGAVLRFQIETYLRGLLDDDGYQFVYTPHVASEKLYERSGHLENYADLMYGAMDIEGNPFRAKPMNCPNHIMIYKTHLHSYRELPIRLAEFGTVYRFEKSGVLHGLLRVRGFTQDDAHIFCRMDQIQEEITKLLRLASRVYKDFGFAKIKSFLSTKPPQSAGDPALWAEAEKMLRAALDAEGFRYEVDEGGGAFYGPKIDLKIEDAIGREWQLCTVQLDFTLPRKFDATYRNDKGGEDQVVMIHRAILGSFERFVGVLIEHYAGNFPLWLAPVQVKVLTVNTEVEAAARELWAKLRHAGLRPAIDAGPDKVGYKVREATLERIPYMVVIGPKDVAAGTLSLRLRDGTQVAAVSPEELIEKLLLEVREKRLTPVFKA
ncbi:MAG: threonine--tRNA ligase [Elusimicrobia bacterium]|nr:threonine--tRNA ligase [Elusimicrobiota bacterium]